MHLSSLCPKYILYREGNQTTLAICCFTKAWQASARVGNTNIHITINHSFHSIANTVLYHIVRVATDFFVKSQYFSQTNISTFQYILPVSKSGKPQFQTLNQTSGTVSPPLPYPILNELLLKRKGSKQGVSI